MIGISVSRLVPQGLRVGDVAQPTNAVPSSSGVPETSLDLPPAAPMPVRGPLQPLQPPSQAVAADVQAPPSLGRLTRAGALINDFITATCSMIPGTEARRNHLAAETLRLEQSLNDAIEAAEALNPIRKTPGAQLLALLEETMKVYYELSQCKGTPEGDQVRLLQKCMDMHDHLQKKLEFRDSRVQSIASTIGRKAHAIYFRMATGVDAERTSDGFAWKGIPREASQVDLLACARAAAMNRHAEARHPHPQTLPLANLYTVQQLQDLPLGAPVDGTKLTKREIDLWCADPPQNPWLVEPRLLRFYDAARDAARELRVREQLDEHTPLSRDVAGIVAGLCRDA